jgi:hypothetical protein
VHHRDEDQQNLLVAARQADSEPEDRERRAPPLLSRGTEVALGETHRDEESERRQARCPAKHTEHDHPHRSPSEVPTGARRRHASDPLGLIELVGNPRDIGAGQEGLP